MEKEIPLITKTDLRAVLLASRKGIPENQVERDYKKIIGGCLKWRDFGFKTLFEFLQAVPDVARMEWSDKHQDNLVYGVGDAENFYMSLHAKKAQGDPSSAKPPKTPEMKRNLLGSSKTPPRQVSYRKDSKSLKVTLNNTLASSAHELAADKQGSLYEIQILGLPSAGCIKVRYDV